MLPACQISSFKWNRLVHVGSTARISAHNRTTHVRVGTWRGYYSNICESPTPRRRRSRPDQGPRSLIARTDDPTSVRSPTLPSRERAHCGGWRRNGHAVESSRLIACGTYGCPTHPSPEIPIALGGLARRPREVSLLWPGDWLRGEVDLDDGTTGYSSSDDGLRIMLNEDAGVPPPQPSVSCGEGCMAEGEDGEHLGSRLKPSVNDNI